MKHDRIAKLLLILAMIACAFCAWQAQSPLAKELEEAYFGARNTMAAISDLENAALPADEWIAQAQKLDLQIDQYFLAGGYLNASAKESISNALRPSDGEVEYTVDHDIPYFHTNYVEIDPSGEQAILHYSKLTYSRRITESDGTYRVFDTGGSSTTAAELVKQDGQWKLAQYLGDDVHWASDSLYVRTMLLNYDPAPGKSFSSFEEALAYAESDPVSMISEPLFFLSSGIVKLLTYFTGGMGY